MVAESSGQLVYGMKVAYGVIVKNLEGVLGMKRLWIAAAGLVLLCLVTAFAAEKPPVSAPLIPRVPEMSTAGKVLEISDTSLKIERTLKGKVETMVFVLEKRFGGIAVGDQIKVSYQVRDGRNILLRVSPAKMTAVVKTKSTAKPGAAPGGSAAPAAK